MVQVSFNKKPMRLLRVRFGFWQNRYKRTVVSFLAENNNAINQRKKCVVFTNTHVLTRVMLCSTLAHQYVSGFCHFAAKYFHTQSFTFRFASVL